MKRPATKKNGEPQPCNREYRVYRGPTPTVKWTEVRYCGKPAGHKGRCGSQTIK